MAKQKSLYFDNLIRVANRYQKDAELCLETGAYFAGMAAVRAALETMLYLRVLAGLMDLAPEELQEIDVNVSNSGDVFHLPPKDPTLKEMIDVTKEKGLIKETGKKAAHRIREWGNKIHGSCVARTGRFPAIGRKNLKGRLNDLSLVAKQIMETM
ncbi:hypothetical protein D6833_03010 [Candidatus Parcubacteria bacterium]|nr:MAG: hypothetical protein D6833_03010 [Candidatus Parcubacteria bacterium]